MKGGARTIRAGPDGGEATGGEARGKLDRGDQVREDGGGRRVGVEGGAAKGKQAGDES